MKQSRKIYDRAFKEKAVQFERHNISELVELGNSLSVVWRKESTKSLDKEVFQVMAS
jgi:transposase